MDQNKLAAVAAGAAVAGTAAVVFKSGLGWAILLGSAGAYLTYLGVQKASTGA